MQHSKGSGQAIPAVLALEPLWTREFVALNLICLLAFGSLSIFYGFYAFLEVCGVAQVWCGPLISLFSVSALLLRPYIATHLKPKIIIPALALGQCVSILALLSYSSLGNTWSLVLVRLIHGAGHVLTLSAAVAMLALIMPPSRSGEGFGINSLAALIPNALVPYLAETFFPQAISGAIYTGGALFMLPGLPALLLLRGAAPRTPASWSGPGKAAPAGTWAQIRQGISQPGAPALLGAFGLAILSIVMLFFFLKPIAMMVNPNPDCLYSLGAQSEKRICLVRQGEDPGLFLFLVTSMIISVRALFSRFFDKVDRKTLCAAGLSAMAAGPVLFALVPQTWAFIAAALIFGLGMGVATPLLTALMFTATPPALRGLNTNLMLQMMDVAHVAGPLMGGLLMSFAASGQAAVSGKALLLASAAAPFAAALLVGRWVPRQSASGAMARVAGAGTVGR
ncbi:MAG: MFS transporter [Deltaproteobacteria bacterium]|nr:MAG: MFS transporter [Deltaproteobacteria bacterium]